MKSRIKMLFSVITILWVCCPNRVSCQETESASSDGTVGLLPKVVGSTLPLKEAAAKLDEANADVLEVRMDIAYVESESMGEIGLWSERLLSVIAMDPNEALALMRRIADDKKKNAAVISRPRVLVQSGSRAQIQVSFNHEDRGNQTKESGSKAINSFDISLTPHLKDQAVVMNTKIEITRTIEDDRDSTPASNAESIAFPYTYQLEKTYVMWANPLPLLVVLSVHRSKVPVSDELRNALSSHKTDENNLDRSAYLLKKEREVCQLRLEVAELRAVCDAAGSSSAANSIVDRKKRSRLRSAELRLMAAETGLHEKRDAIATTQMGMKPNPPAESVPVANSLKEIHVDVKHLQQGVDRLIQLLEARK